MKKINLIGSTISYLTIVGEMPFITNGHKRYQWLCKCICGNEVVRSTTRLLNKLQKVHSCGCKSFTHKHGNQKYEDPTLISYNAYIKRYKNTCKHKNKKWLLTNEEAIELFNSCCFYCGIVPSNNYNVYVTKYKQASVTKNIDRAKKALIKVNGIDRIDSTLNYSRDNVVACCTTCNFAKNTLSLSDFYNWINRISTYQRIKNEINCN